MTDVDNLANEILNGLLEYSDEIDEKMQDVINKKAHEVVELLKNHPNIPEKTGAYKKSFKAKKLAQGKGYNRILIYAGNGQHSLTHLLEKGHPMPQGGRARAFPHWKDAQQKAEECYNELMEELQK